MLNIALHKLNPTLIKGVLFVLQYQRFYTAVASDDQDCSSSSDFFVLSF